MFDAAGDAIHKVHLRETSDLAAWEASCRDLALPDQQTPSTFGERSPVEGAKINEDRAQALRDEWVRMTDTHQFNTLVRRLKMNRLGAYRIAGEPLARRLSVDAVNLLLEGIHADGHKVMLFVGNMGCIEIYSGGIETLKPMGPWQNVLDDRFNLHLRLDHVAEVWLVDKPTKRGPAISVEAFDEQGGLIFQCFGMRPEIGGDPEAWASFATALPAGEGE